MTYKIALPTVAGNVDGHFGHCELFTIFTIDDSERILAREGLKPPAGCGCKSAIIPELADLGVQVLLAGNMGEGAAQKLRANGIEVVRGCTGEVMAVTEAFLAGKVEDSGQGCSEHGHGHGAGGCGNH